MGLAAALAVVLILLVIHGPEGFVHPMLTAMHVEGGARRCAGRIAGRNFSGDEHCDAGRGRCFSPDLRAISCSRERTPSPDVAFFVAAAVLALALGAVPGDGAAGPRDGGSGVDMSERFTGSFTQQEPIPEAGIEAAMAVLRHGRLHRYNTAPGEIAETALLEEEFAALSGAKYCLAVASGGYAMATARLRALGVRPGDPVLSNAFTLAPVPGAIAAMGARAGLCRGDGGPDHRPGRSGGEGRGSGAKVLLLSHMRGHVCDMDALMAICDAAGREGDRGLRPHDGGAVEGRAVGAAWGVRVLFDADLQAHEFGRGRVSGHGRCRAMARAILLSGVYMLYARHRAAPAPEVFEELRLDIPNISGRMDNLRAAILRPQIAMLETGAARWEVLYRRLEAGLAGTPGLRLIARPQHEQFVGSSLPVPVAGLAGGAGAGAGRATCGAGGGAEMVRRGGPGGLYQPL